MIPELNMQDYLDMRDAGTCITIDVREVDEFNQARIEGAINIPLSEFEARMEEIPAESTIVFQCRSGARSQTAGALFMQNHPKAKMYNLTGGILAWASAGFKTL